MLSNTYTEHATSVSVAQVLRSEGDLALERWFPELRGRIPRVPLTRLPTRVHRLEHLSRQAGEIDLWIKRDDESGLWYGGNKPRKLEFVLADALTKGRTTVMTFGGIGTHHGLATTICARQLGLRTILMLIRQPVTQHVREGLLLDYAAGAELHFASSVPLLVARALCLCARELRRGALPYVVPTGGTTALGTLGYVNAAAELQEQIASGELPEPETIFVPMGSGGTIAGLVLGAKIVGLRSRFIAVLVTDVMPPSPVKLAREATASLRLLQQHVPDLRDLTVSAGDFSIVRGYTGACYGAPTDEGRRARDLMRSLEAIQLDTTYTGKCLAAMLDATGSRTYRHGPILFWNTYSSVNLANQFPTLPDFHELPRAFHRFFAGPTVPA